MVKDTNISSNAPLKKKLVNIISLALLVQEDALQCVFLFLLIGSRQCCHTPVEALEQNSLVVVLKVSNVAAELTTIVIEVKPYV